MSQAYKETLIEELSLHFEELHQLPPLASRIYSFILLNGMQGFTFEELLEIVSASKSSISTNINLLIEKDMIEYTQQEGDRKRYFRKKPNQFKCRLLKYSSLVSKDIELFDRCLIYLQENQKEHISNCKDQIDLYKEFLIKNQELLQETLSKLEKIEYQLN